MNSKQKEPRDNFRKRFIRGCIHYFGALVGSLLVFLCFYWFFHFETWHERFIYISLSIAVVY
ncbi:hypothetical protein B7R70_13620, partial [Yersinia pseudotuberculosis]